MLSLIKYLQINLSKVSKTGTNLKIFSSLYSCSCPAKKYSPSICLLMSLYAGQFLITCSLVSGSRLHLGHPGGSSWNIICRCLWNWLCPVIICVANIAFLLFIPCIIFLAFPSLRVHIFSMPFWLELWFSYIYTYISHRPWLDIHTHSVIYLLSTACSNSLRK